MENAKKKEKQQKMFFSMMRWCFLIILFSCVFFFIISAAQYISKTISEIRARDKLMIECINFQLNTTTDDCHSKCFPSKPRRQRLVSFSSHIISLRELGSRNDEKQKKKSFVEVFSRARSFVHSRAGGERGEIIFRRMNIMFFTFIFIYKVATRSTGSHTISYIHTTTTTKREPR